METTSTASPQETPLVSVCVCTYNQEHYIADCLESIVTQETTFPYEVIVGDDASTDRTSEIVADYARRYPDRIVNIRYPANIGPFKNYVETHNRARGRFIAHIDGDDLMRPGKLQAQADFLLHNPDFTVTWHRMDVFNDSGSMSPGSRQDLSAFEDGVVHLDEAVALGCVGIHSSCMYRETARKTRVAERQCLDTFMAWEFLSSGLGKILPQTLGGYRMNSSTSMRRQIDTRQLSIADAREFLRRRPDQRANVQVFAACNVLIDLKNRRPTAKVWARLALDCKTVPNPLRLARVLVDGRKFVMPKLD